MRTSDQFPNSQPNEVRSFWRPITGFKSSNVFYNKFIQLGSIADRYLYLGQIAFNSEVQSHEKFEQKNWQIGLKVLSYGTLVLPIVALVIKVVFKIWASFQTEDKSSSSEQAIFLRSIPREFDFFIDIDKKTDSSDPEKTIVKTSIGCFDNMVHLWSHLRRNPLILQRIGFYNTPFLTWCSDIFRVSALLIQSKEGQEGLGITFPALFLEINKNNKLEGLRFAPDQDESTWNNPNVIRSFELFCLLGVVFAVNSLECDEDILNDYLNYYNVKVSAELKYPDLWELVGKINADRVMERSNQANKK